MPESNETQNSQNPVDPSIENQANKMYDNKGDKEDAKVDDKKDNEGQNEVDKPSEKTTDESKKAEESKEKDAKATGYDKIVAPKMPEGMEVDNNLLDGIKEVAGKHNLSKEALQELIDFYGKHIVNSDTNLKNYWEKVEKGWADELKNDKEIGGDKLEDSKFKAKKAIDNFMTPALKDYLNETRLGNHPEMIKLMVKIGDKISEDIPAIKGGSKAQMNPADILYDKTKK